MPTSAMEQNKLRIVTVRGEFVIRLLKVFIPLVSLLFSLVPCCFSGYEGLLGSYKRLILQLKRKQMHCGKSAATRNSIKLLLSKMLKGGFGGFAS